MAESIQRLPQVEARTGLKRSTIYLNIQQGSFPAPVKLGPRAVGWRESDIDAWIESRPIVRHDAESANAQSA